MRIGKIIDETSFPRKRRRYNIFNIQIDILEGKDKVIGEVKKSMRMQKAHKIQLLYYLFVLKSLGLDFVGEILYPAQKKRAKVVLEKADEEYLKEILQQMERLKKQEKPPKLVRKPFCKSCSLFEICYS